MTFKAQVARVSIKDELKTDFGDIPADLTRDRMYFYTAAVSVIF